MLACNAPIVTTVIQFQEDLTTTASTAYSIDHSTQLGGILLKQKWISEVQLKFALNLQQFCHKKLGEILIVQGLISSDQLRRALREQHWRRKGFWVI